MGANENIWCGGHTIGTVTSCEGCEACIRVDNRESEMFKLIVGLSQGYILDVA